MVKKVIKKRASKKKTYEKKAPVNEKEEDHEEESQEEIAASERERILIENFVGLQKAMTNLAIKFNTLSENISKLLQVFEEAAKSYAQTGNTDNEDLLKKINSLLEQNKTIAKGLVLMESKLRGKTESKPALTPQQPREFSRPRPRPLPSI